MEFLYQVYIVITKFTIIIILIFILPPWDPPWWPPGRPWWPPGRPCPRLCWTSVSSGSPEDSSVPQTNTRASIILCIQYILFCCCSELLSGNMSCVCIFFNFTTLRWCRICANTGMTQSVIVGFVFELNCCNSLRSKTIRDIQPTICQPFAKCINSQLNSKKHISVAFCPKQKTHLRKCIWSCRW